MGIPLSGVNFEGVYIYICIYIYTYLSLSFSLSRLPEAGALVLGQHMVAGPTHHDSTLLEMAFEEVGKAHLLAPDVRLGPVIADSPTNELVLPQRG